MRPQKTRETVQLKADNVVVTVRGFFTALSMSDRCVSWRRVCGLLHTLEKFESVASWQLGHVESYFFGEPRPTSTAS